jgi:predicted deacylase
MWYPKVKEGDCLTMGQKIGRVGDLFGDTLETVVSPVDGTVLFLTINPSVEEKGLLMGIGAE